MRSFAKKIARFLSSEEGPTAVEYAMMLLLILLAVLTMVTVLGESASTSFQESHDAIEEAIPAFQPQGSGQSAGQ